MFLSNLRTKSIRKAGARKEKSLSRKAKATEKAFLNPAI